MGVLRPCVGGGSWLGSLRGDNCHWVVANTLVKACMHWNICLVFCPKQASGSLLACFCILACIWEINHAILDFVYISNSGVCRFLFLRVRAYSPSNMNLNTQF